MYMLTIFITVYLLLHPPVYKLELAKFMFALNNNRLPKVFYDSFTKLESVHDHNTRQLTKNVYFKLSVNKNISRETLLYKGGSVWGEIDINSKTANWASFNTKYKKTLIES